MTEHAGGEQQNPQNLAEATVYDQSGEKVGGVDEVFTDETGAPAFVTVKTGWFGLRASIVPLEGASIGAGEVRVPFTKDQIKDAPNVDAAGVMDGSGRDELRSYYGLGALGAGVPASGLDLTPSGQEHGADPTATFSSAATSDELGQASTRPEGYADDDVEAQAQRQESEGAQVVQDADLAADQSDTGYAADQGDAAYAADQGEGQPQPVNPQEWGNEPVAATAENQDAFGEGEHHRDPAGPHSLTPIQPYEAAPGEHLVADGPRGRDHTGDRIHDEVSRTGYADDQPAAHQWAYEGGHAPGDDPSAAAAEVSGHVADGAAQQPETVGEDVPEAGAGDLAAGGQAQAVPQEAAAAAVVHGDDPGYQDHDGVQMSDEERQRLNEARGAL